MLAVAVTGNIASGKSTVARLFERWGAARLDADAVVRDLQAPGQPVLQAIRDRFGSGIIDAAGQLDRAALRALILDDPAARGDLNAIVHPAVRRRIGGWLDDAARAGTGIAVVEIPLLFEAGLAGRFDRVVLVEAPVEAEVARLETHRGLTREVARGLLASQQPPDAKRARSDFVIENAGSASALEARAREVWRALSDGA